MKSFLAAAAVSVFLFASCNNSSHADIDTSLPATTNTNAPTEVNSLNDTLPDTGIVPGVQATPLPQAVPQAPAKVYQTAGLNPPHGQPGHDCAIAVGAPLNGSRTPNAAPNPAPTMNFPATTPITAPVSTTGGQRLNPPHGQPGHDCAVQVGAPLG